MEQLLQGNTSMLVPGVIALGLVIVGLKIAIAVEHALLRLASALLIIAVLGTVLLVGWSASGRLQAIQAAADTALHNVSTAQQVSSGTISTGAMMRALDGPTRQALVAAGLDPRPLRLQATCQAAHAYLHVRYADNAFLFGVLSSHDIVLPLPAAVRCKA